MCFVIDTSQILPCAPALNHVLAMVLCCKQMNSLDTLYRHLVHCNATVPPPAPVQMQYHVQMSCFPSSRTAPMLNVTCKKLHSLQA